MLDLKRLYWNCRVFLGGKRKGRCPYEHLGLKRPEYDFWSLLPEEMSPAFAEAKAKAATQLAILQRLQSPTIRLTRKSAAPKIINSRTTVGA